MPPAKVIAFDAAARGPLQGTRVLDLSRLVAGNVLTLQLADFGAEVIKIEPPEGDPLRAWREDGHSLFWKAYCRNKLSVMLNLRDPVAKDAFLTLLDTADVMVENYRPGTLEAMGLAPETLLARNPRLVVVRISGFGQTGPYALRPGFGTIVEGMSGFAARNGFADREPVLPPMALADILAGLSGAMSVVTALLARERGLATGQVIDLSLLEPLFAAMGPEAAIHRQTGLVKERTGSSSKTSSPRNAYLCADGGYVAMSGSTPAMAHRIFRTIGRPDMVDDPRFRTNTDRVRNRELVDAIIGEWFAGRTREAALAELQAGDVTAGPIYNIDDALADPHFIAREVIVEVEDDELGSLPMHNITPRMSATPGAWRCPAPELGEHTRALLSAAGVPAATVDTLCARVSP